MQEISRHGRACLPFDFSSSSSCCRFTRLFPFCQTFLCCSCLCKPEQVNSPCQTLATTNCIPAPCLSNSTSLASLSTTVVFLPDFLQQHCLPLQQYFYCILSNCIYAFQSCRFFAYSKVFPWSQKKKRIYVLGYYDIHFIISKLYSGEADNYTKKKLHHGAQVLLYRFPQCLDIALSAELVQKKSALSSVDYLGSNFV